MRWLQLANIDLANGMGGVEFHARRVNLELSKLGHFAQTSQDFSQLSNPEWDVVQTHGSAVEILPILKRRLLGHSGSKPFHLHTLHGTSWERVLATKEFFFLGAYLAGARELIATFCADALVSGHPETSFYKMARALGRPTGVCLNGWDMPEIEPGNEKVLLPQALQTQIQNLGPYWLFVGRGSDPVKGAVRLQEAMRATPEFRLVVVPGEGFEASSQIFCTGKLSAGELSWVLNHARGLVLPSLYEGYSIALVEALALGLEVIATPVGAVPLIRDQVQGLTITSDISPRALAETIAFVQSENSSMGRAAESRALRAAHNQSVLARWKDVALVDLKTVEGAFTQCKPGKPRKTQTA